MIDAARLVVGTRAEQEDTMMLETQLKESLEAGRG